jgi:hypothetical protein
MLTTRVIIIVLLPTLILGVINKIKSPIHPVSGPGKTGRKLPISPRNIRNPAKIIKNRSMFTNYKIISILQKFNRLLKQ